ncbi:hypothetical protein COCMIDRAFT_30428 [Bipolaris oryzae ATCC 44560]|uniref:Uncharacterized protein n=1 Tax=Bipolaris oryzae ATCC 44560 TaxID=930090 RepID=W6YT22_COCMI|nr:uncharacterized protein COCMIDRAFT_30428 [Bipolaris oryzae ATCC 44560]EUC40668.1 hypothetical protein COCMIDRAFT_30428 [Bipolaris oryzae ATCC 44560]
MESLPPAWIKRDPQRGEVLTHSGTSSAPSTSISNTLHHPETTTGSVYQRSHTLKIGRSKKSTSDPQILQFPHTRTLPTPTRFSDYMETMKSESEQHGPTVLPSARQVFRKRREYLLVQALKDSIINFSRTNLALRTSIAEEVKKGIEGNLTGIEKDPIQIVTTVGSHGKTFWSRVHQECYHSHAVLRSQPLHQIYSKKDIERILFFWAVHQSTLSYGDIACKLHLPVGALLSWILGFIDRPQEI